MTNTTLAIVVVAVLALVGGAYLMHHPGAHSALRSFMHSAH
jgi:hypothetical protein